MSKLFYVGGYNLSELRNWLTCDGLVGGYTTASSIRSQYAGAGSTGSMAFATNTWIDSRCWTLDVYTGSGVVRVESPWVTAWSTSIYPPQDYAQSSKFNVWTTINASESTNYTFSYWMREDPWEIWSYNRQVSYYIPTGGWENTWHIGAAFDYVPPVSNCYTYQMYYYTYWDGIDCNGYYTSGYSYYGDQVCLQYLYSGGYQLGVCDPNCLVKGTTIEMADGSHKLIEKIRVGDILKGIKISDAPEDDTITGWSTNNLTLTETEVRVRSIVPISTKTTYIFNSGLIESTAEHAHFIKRDNIWKFERTENIQVGDFLVDKQGNSIEIETIEVYEHIKETETDLGKPRKIVYDIDVETTDTFIANGLITHNRPIKEIQ